MILAVYMYLRIYEFCSHLAAYSLLLLCELTVNAVPEPELPLNSSADHYCVEVLSSLPTSLRFLPAHIWCSKMYAVAEPFNFSKGGLKSNLPIE